jgi:hypothetical protein
MIRSCLAASVLFCVTGWTQTPVVVELFTSEGCSSCPPADVLLTRLETTQPVGGAHIIALSEHVNYWDGLGWRDPFSSLQFTERQREYAEALHDQGPYTPQMVIDGATGFVGSDASEAIKTIAKAARMPKAAVTLSSAGGKLQINVASVPMPADVILAVTESGLASSVSAGENKGRRLTHTAVVRSLRVVGQIRSMPRSKEPFAAEVTTPIAKSWNLEMLRAVVILEEPASHKILGAAEIPLTRL